MLNGPTSTWTFVYEWEAEMEITETCSNHPSTHPFSSKQWLFSVRLVGEQSRLVDCGMKWGLSVSHTVPRLRFFFLKLCCTITILKILDICVSVIPAEVVFNLYSTLIILQEQQSSSHCHDVKAPPYYIRGDYTSKMRKRIDQLKESPTQLLPKEFCTMWAWVIFDIGRLW